MTKRAKSLDAEASQLSLFDLLQKEREESQAEPGEGSMNIHDRLRVALSLALKHALPKSRWEAAGELSHLLGVEISKYQIDSWVCESKEGHRIPAEYLHVFCRVTGCTEPLQILNESCQLFTVKGPDALRADIRKREEKIKVEQKEVRKMAALIDALEGKK